ncbi:MAG: radical SAM protein [Deltaproteobacteria bacterium]|nr:radical SAM protein [Deltaproteobacteria bacterium]
MVDPSLCFETGPIRPPNEARSLLLRLTRNCPWNHCRFCPVYKGRKFSLRPVADIKADIQAARDIADDILSLSDRLGRGGNIDDPVVSYIYNNPGYNDCYRSIAGWLYYGTHACFLQDADNLIMKTEDLVEVLTFLRSRFPDLERVTTYSRSKTVSKKSVVSLKKICEAGLNRIHIGLESGFDPVLKLMKKGATAAIQIDAGQKVMAAGMELSEYVMPGLGGRELWEGHARETARVLNQINPHFIRLRSLRVPARVPLHQKLVEGEFSLQTDDMLAEEIRVFIETLDGITSTVTSDHIMNLLEDVSGKLPEDKGAMLAVIENYQSLSDHDRLIYRIGRRGGTYRSINDLRDDPATYHKIQNLVADIKKKEGDKGLEDLITGLADRYI